MTLIDTNHLVRILRKVLDLESVFGVPRLKMQPRQTGAASIDSNLHSVHKQQLKRMWYSLLHNEFYLRGVCCYVCSTCAVYAVTFVRFHSVSFDVSC